MVANGACYPNSMVIGTASINDSLGGAIKVSFNGYINTLSKTPIWSGSSLKTSGGQASQALGRSRGGFSTKIHIAVDGLGNPLHFMLTAGQRHDITCAEALIDGYNSEYVIADTSYDSVAFVKSITQRGAVPVIPPRANRRDSRTYDVHLYRERHLVECFINKIKQYRRISSRFDKLVVRYLGFLSFVAAIIWLR